MTDRDALPVTDLVARAWVRMIPTAFYKPPVLSPLADGEDDLAALAELEGLTNRRLRGEREGTPGLDPRELAYRARRAALGTWGHTHVNAAFLYRRAGGNRFNGADRGAWYCAEDDLTALTEVGYHKTRELGFTRLYEDETCYQALLADFIGPFPDLRARPDDPSLDPDPTRGYPAGQALAERLRDQGYAALIYPSVRHAGGSCLAAFEPQGVQNLRPGAKWWLSWTGSPDYTIRGE